MNWILIISIFLIIVYLIRLRIIIAFNYSRSMYYTTVLTEQYQSALIHGMRVIKFAKWLNRKKLQHDFEENINDLINENKQMNM